MKITIKKWKDSSRVILDTANLGIIVARVPRPGRRVAHPFLVQEVDEDSRLVTKKLRLYPDGKTSVSHRTNHFKALSKQYLWLGESPQDPLYLEFANEYGYTPAPEPAKRMLLLFDQIHEICDDVQTARQTFKAKILEIWPSLEDTALNTMWQDTVCNQPGNSRASNILDWDKLVAPAQTVGL